MTTVKAFGREVPIMFNMAVQLAYEVSTGCNFMPGAFTSARLRIALYLAAIKTADPKTDITEEKLLYASVDDIDAIDFGIAKLMADWYHTPLLEGEESEQENGEEDTDPN